MAESRKRPRRVFLHVGLPGTGRLLAESLARHATALLDQGLRYPDGGREMRAAALDVIGQDSAWGEDPDAVRGAFTRIATKRPGRKLDLLIGHELLAEASAEQASYALSMLTNAEVHLVVVAQDPARQAMARAQTPWLAHRNVLAVFDLWGATLRPECVHVVTAPPPGSDPALLWRRFGEALGRDVSALDPVGGGPTPLEARATALLGRVTESSDPRAAGSRSALERYAQEVLAARSHAPAAVPSVPSDAHVDAAERWVEEVDAGGYAVHGDLADLRPVPPDDGTARAESLPVEDVLDLAVEATADLLAELATEQARVAALEAEVARLQRKREKLRRRLRRLDG